jgi:hypothetical protein
MNRFYWACDLVGTKYSPTLREDIEVRIHDRKREDMVVYAVQLPQVTFDESRVQSARVFDLFLLTQLENQP